MISPHLKRYHPRLDPRHLSAFRGHSARVAWALLRNAGSTSEVLHQDPLSNTLSMLQRPPVKPRPPVEQEEYSPRVPCFHTQSGLRHVVLEECHPQTPSDPSHLGPVYREALGTQGSVAELLINHRAKKTFSSLFLMQNILLDSSLLNFTLP